MKLGGDEKASANRYPPSHCVCLSDVCVQSGHIFSAHQSRGGGNQARWEPKGLKNKEKEGCSIRRRRDVCTAKRAAKKGRIDLSQLVSA